MEESQIAFHSMVRLYDVSHSLRSGIRVTISLENESQYAVFREAKKSTKKLTVIYLLTWKTASADKWFRDEVMFVGYTVNNVTGAKVKFQCNETDTFDRFMGLEDGEQIEIFLAELDDNGVIIDQSARGRVETSEQVLKGGPKSKWAARKCQDEDFQTFVSIRGGYEKSPEGARQFIYDRSQISSRRDLDNDDLAWQRFKTMVKSPYIQWLHRQSNGIGL